MSGLLDFLAFAFVLAMIAFVVFFVIVGNRIDFVMNIMSFLAPIGVFMSIFLVFSRFRIKEIRRKKDEGSDDLILYLRYTDKIISDLVMVSTPVVIMLIAFLSRGDIAKPDILQAFIVFIILFLFFRRLYGKEA